jgi:DNA end-binding protein Ku
MTTAGLRVRDDVLVMQTMMWPDEIRKPDFSGLEATEEAAKPQELKMARMLVETLAGDYDPDEFEDDYASAVEALVQTKLEGGEVKHAAPEEPKTGEVVDLLAALQRSVEAAKSSRGETAASSGETAEAETGETEAAGEGAADEAEEKPAKRAAAKRSGSKKAASSTSSKSGSSKKAPAKKTASKKSPTKKTAAKKTAKKAS